MLMLLFCTFVLGFSSCTLQQSIQRVSSVRGPKLCDPPLWSIATHRGLLFHFLFVTVVKGFLAISAAAGRGEKINTFNVTCGPWNKGMICVGMAAPCIIWDLCLVAGRVERRKRNPEQEEL